MTEKNYVTHWCPKYYLPIVSYDVEQGRWYLELEETREAINFCPYCGEKLEPPDVSRMEKPEYERPVPKPIYIDDCFIVISPRGFLYYTKEPVKLPEDWCIPDRSDRRYYDENGKLRQEYWSEQALPKLADYTRLN